MSIIVGEDTKLVVSGLTGREGSFHGLRNRDYGTDLVTGVTPKKGGQDVDGVPIFDTIAESVAERGANTSMIFVPAPFAAAAMDEAIDAGIETIIAITEGIPVHDMLRVYWRAKEAGVEDAFSYPGFVPAFIRDSFCEGRGPFRWVALSGDPEDIHATDRALLDLFPDDTRLQSWLSYAADQIAFQGLPARICWLGYRERDRAARLFNEMVADGRLKAPIVIGRDHLDSGSVASPNRETEGMKDGSDAVADWPILNALINAVGGASWVSVHHGGGVGMGYSLHAGMVIVADGTDDAARRLERVLWNDPGTGVMRHADAGYAIAVDCAREQGLDLPMIAELPSTR